jgi:OmcA/MtrC family decaheme c-type cytochrome
MNWVDKLSARTWSILVIGMLAFAFSGCEGDTGPAGPTGATGPEGPEGPAGPVPDDVTAAIEAADAESCGTCHGTGGDKHQAAYDEAFDSDFELTITGHTLGDADPDGNFPLGIIFSIDHMGAPFDVDPTSDAWVDGLFFAVSHWDDTAEMFQLVGGPFDPYSGITGPIISMGGGSYVLDAALPYDTRTWDSGAIVGKLSDGAFDFPDNPYTGPGSVEAYEDLSLDALNVGIGQLADDYTSLANVEGCEACHGAPYRKHANIQASVPGAPDFTYCKSCHYDDRPGTHTDWQYMVDEPLNWANDEAETADYSYTANLMNDTHMSHAMEFPYPQSMSNCATCHEGNIAAITDDTYFTAATCQSCHPVQGLDAWPADAGTTTKGLYAQPHRAPPLEFLWTRANVDSYHDVSNDCTTGCHGVGAIPSLADFHSGYDDHIYDANGVKYADSNPVVIDSITMAGNSLTVNFSAVNTDIVPEVLVSLYGWDSKNFIIASHTRDGNAAACPGSHGDGCQMEFVPITAGGAANPLFTEDPASVLGDWMVTVDFAAFTPTVALPEDIPTLIADGVIKMAEVTILAELDVGGEKVYLSAPSDTFDLGGSMIVADYFKDANAAVSVEKCNACHDVLTSAHGGRGGDDIVVCKNCHVTTNPGSHLEMASRGIDSYVHAIHTFQPFDENKVYNYNAYGPDGTTDPVFNARNEQHKHHTLPFFTALACEACHVEGTYNVPDQSKSMPGVQSASWDIDDPNARAIGTVPEYVTGPASRACGGCHRADMVVHDDAGGLTTFDAHTDAFGTLEENDPDDLVLYGIIDKIMSMFE